MKLRFVRPKKPTAEDEVAPFGLQIKGMVEGVVDAYWHAERLLNAEVEEAPQSNDSDEYVIPGAAMIPDYRLGLQEVELNFRAPISHGGLFKEERTARVRILLASRHQLESYERVRAAVNEQLDQQIQSKRKSNG